jgi:hypothetical protein
VAEVSDTLLSSARILDRLGHEELKLKQLGLVNQAAGMRTAIVQILKLVSEDAPQPKSIESEND